MTQEKGTAVWEFLPLHQFRKPSQPAAETVRKGFRSIWRRIRAAARDEPEPVAAKIQAAHGGLLERVSPRPEWDAAADALGAALAERSDDRSAPRHPLAVVGPPYGAAARALRLVAESNKWAVAAVPTDILSGGSEFVGKLDWKEKPLVLLHLEKFFLRQHDGLDLMRRLLERLLDEQKPFVLHCGSWAWRFLLKAVQIDSAVREVLALQAFDAERLQRWFRELADCSVRQPMKFLQADNGAPVLPSPGSCAKGDEESEETEELTGFLKNLASFSRGNPGVALQIWRRGLGISRDAEKEANESESEVHDPNTIWVTPWSSLKFPALPSTGKLDLFILNALLIHDGLGLPELCHVVGDSSVEIRQRLGRLAESGVVERENGVWQVSPVAYPGVREYLSSEGFLVDGF